MKKFLGIAIVALVLTACGSDEEFTWGDISSGIADGFCSEFVDCGFMTEDKVERCVRHNVHHLCELDGICDAELSSQAEEDLSECLEALDSYSELDDDGVSCFLLGLFGVLPQECDVIWEYEPKED